ncbi:HRSL1 enzyme, partial [Toxostoma redivivum]|nr:HRSL1 enzyme [Toxostoma redivivum]
ISSLSYIGKQSVKLEKQKTTQTVALFTRTVTMQCLKKVVRRHKWRVNNKSDQCQTPLPVEEIIQCAEAYIGKEMTYCSFGRNCEHFVKKLRYGEGVSDQVSAT